MEKDITRFLDRLPGEISVYTTPVRRLSNSVGDDSDMDMILLVDNAGKGANYATTACIQCKKIIKEDPRFTKVFFQATNKDKYYLIDGKVYSVDGFDWVIHREKHIKMLSLKHNLKTKVKYDEIPMVNADIDLYGALYILRAFLGNRSSVLREKRCWLTIKEFKQDDVPLKWLNEQLVTLFGMRDDKPIFEFVETIVDIDKEIEL